MCDGSYFHVLHPAPEQKKHRGVSMVSKASTARLHHMSLLGCCVGDVRHQ